MDEDFLDNPFTNAGEGGCSQGTAPVFVDGSYYGCASFSTFSNYYNPYDNITKGPVIRINSFEDIYGSLPEGAVDWEVGDLDRDGLNEVYAVDENGDPHTVFSGVLENVTQTPYDDWLEQYGQTEDPAIRDKANQSASDLNSILGGIGNEQEISDYLYGLASGPMPEPTGTGPSVEVDVFQCLSEGGSWLDCTTLGVVLQIPGIPALPSAILGSIFREKTLREIIEDIENAADTVKEVIGDIKDVFDPNVDSKLDEKIKGILTTIRDKVKGIFDGDGSGEITIGDIDEILKGVGGAILTGVFGVLVETGKDAIEDTLGLPPGTLLTTDKLSSDSCFAQGFQVAGDGSDKWNCSDVKIAGQPCQGPYNSTGETDERGNCKFVEDAACQPPNEPAGTAGKIDANGNCIAVGGDDDDDDDDVTLTTEEQICKNTGRKYDDLNDECLQECDNSEYIILADGNCGPDPTTTGTGYSPVCTEPRPTGELTFALQEQQMMWDQQCAATHCPTGKEYDYFPEDTNKSGSFEYDGQLYTYDPCDPFGKENSLTSTPITETGGSCPAGSERDDPFYDSRDTDQSGFFVSNGITYSYDPCNPSSGFSIAGQNVNVCEDQNNLNYGNIVQQPEEPCGDCKPGFDKPEGYTNCTSFEDLCRDQAPGYGPNDDNPACGAVVEPSCDDPNRKQNPDGSCADECKDGFEIDEKTGINSPTFGKCVPIQQGPPDCEQINPATGQPSPRDDMGECIDCEDEANALACGWVDCGDNVYAPTQNACPTAPPPNPCDDPVYAAENQDECGPVVDPCDDPVYAAQNPQECGYTCDDPNATVQQGGLTPGACGPCKEGYVFDGALERCVQESVDPCDDAEYAAANPTECGTCNDCSCAEYAAANPEECAPAPPPETGGDSGSVGGSFGAFSPFMAGIDYTKQPLPTAPAAPQKDYMAELDNLIKRSLFEGIV